MDSTVPTWIEQRSLFLDTLDCIGEIRYQQSILDVQISWIFVLGFFNLYGEYFFTCLPKTFYRLFNISTALFSILSVNSQKYILKASTTSLLSKNATFLMSGNKKIDGCKIRNLRPLKKSLLWADYLRSLSWSRIIQIEQTFDISSCSFLYSENLLRSGVFTEYPPIYYSNIGFSTVRYSWKLHQLSVIIYCPVNFASVISQ